MFFLDAATLKGRPISRLFGLVGVHVHSERNDALVTIASCSDKATDRGRVLHLPYSLYRVYIFISSHRSGLREHADVAFESYKLTATDELGVVTFKNETGDWFCAYFASIWINFLPNRKSKHHLKRLCVKLFYNIFLQNEVDLVSTNSNDKPSGRIAVPPPNNLRKIFSDVSTSFIRNIITSLLASTSAPIRNGGIVNGAPILNPVAAPIVNTGAVGALVGGGASQVFFSPVRINIDQASQLYVPPGTDGRIIVLLKNDGVGDFFLLSGGDDKNFFIQFDYAQYVEHKNFCDSENPLSTPVN